MMKRKPSLFLLSLLLAACQSSQLSAPAYAAWVREHRADLTTTATAQPITASLTYLPADWLAVNEAGAEHPEQIAVARREYEGLEYYRLRVAAASGQGDLLQLDAGSTNTYYQRVQYFSFGLQQDLRLLAGQDTLPCRLFHFERNYGAAPYADFMLGFEDKGGNKWDRVLIYHDRVFTDSLIQLVIPAENIDQVPTLKL